MSNTTARLTWHRGTYTGDWSTEAPEFRASARRLTGYWYLTVWQFGQVAKEGRYRVLTEAKAEAQLWANVTAEALA